MAPVSTGNADYVTPSGTFTAMSMNEVWYSKEWDNAPMPHAIFFMKDGHAIHGSYEVKNVVRRRRMVTCASRRKMRNAFVSASTRPTQRSWKKKPPGC